MITGYFGVIIQLIMIPVAINGQQREISRVNEPNRLSQFYLNATGSEREYIDGKDYYPYYFRARNTPVLREGEERAAILTIHGRKYYRLVLNYDTFTDDVFFTDDSLIYDNKVRMVALNKNEAASFDLCFRRDTLHFRYFSKTADPAFNLDDGYYEVVLEGEIVYLIRHRSHSIKKTSSYSASSLIEYVYEPENYIKVGNRFSRITSRSQFAALFGDKSGEISRYILRRRINVLKADKKQMLELLNYYEQIN